MAIRRDRIEVLGGWDERLGAGTRPFPASEDMDFNYRLLRQGDRAFITTAVRASHQQWRSPAELPALFEGYMAGWAGFAMKHLRQGDVRGGLWLWSLSLRDIARSAGGALRRRSALRLRVLVAKVRGLLSGTARGLLMRW